MTILSLNESSSFGLIFHDSLEITIDLDRDSPVVPTDIVTKAIRHLTGFVSPKDGLEPIPHRNYQEVARRYYQDIYGLYGTGVQTKLFLAQVTAFFHELRHAHDLLCTATSQNLFLKFRNCYQNLPALYYALKEWQSLPGNCRIPLPLPKNPTSLSDMPVEVIELILKCFETLEISNKFLSSHDLSYASLSVSSLLEFSAMNVQFDAARVLFGEEAAQLLVKMIIESGKANVYLNTWNEVRDLFLARGFPKYGLESVVNYIVWCALTSAPPEGKPLRESPHPVVLFEALVENVSRNCRESTINSCLKSVKDFCKVWGLEHPESTVARQQSIMEKQTKIAQNLQIKATNEVTRDILRITQGFTKTYENLNQYIKVDAEIYFTGQLYLQHLIAGYFPSIPVRLYYQGESHLYMSRGTPIVGKNDWLSLAPISMGLKILLLGRHKTGHPQLEEEVFKEMTEGGKDGFPLRFYDTSFEDTNWS